MNICFMMGTIVEIERFKFILNKQTKHKSRVAMRIKLIDGKIIEVIAYDQMADYILRNEFLNSVVFVQGELESKSRREIIINAYYIEKLRGVIAKNEKEENKEQG